MAANDDDYDNSANITGSTGMIDSTSDTPDRTDAQRNSGSSSDPTSPASNSPNTHTLTPNPSKIEPTSGVSNTTNSNNTASDSGHTTFTPEHTPSNLHGTKSNAQPQTSQNADHGRHDTAQPKSQVESPSSLPEQGPTQTKPKVLVLCFDGTGNQFGTNSNVVRLFTALTKDEPESQLCYYMPGIGTYTKRQFIFKSSAKLYLHINSAVAMDLNDRVKEGYTFLMQNYRKGDKICLFGFSRGAYTARALSGMVYKVGLLPPHNVPQVDFAFTMYNTSDKDGARLARQFKQTFAIDVAVDFLGVWDTVSAVGIIPRSLPHSTYNNGVKVFRHALALDEQRARFRPSVWGEPVGAREELDEEPQVTLRGPGVTADEWVYDPPDVPDIKEVWFAGCHADVGGGSHEDVVIQSLSNITLRWMIKECYQQKKEKGLNILFREDILRTYGLHPRELETDPEGVAIHSRPGDADAKAEQEQQERQNEQNTSFTDLALRIWKRDVTDLGSVIYNQLTRHPAWWILEFIPMLYTHQQPDGSWMRFRRRNLGRGRYIPHTDHRVRVHISVRDRIEDKRFAYKPKAFNWSAIYEKDKKDKIITWDA
ncbi:hypothetical protein AX16_000675 [Volvariella volvacea WC 439]|nr:hypothetical protein AX16_000675 [Volvariella volvacea WC 439]